MDSFKKFIAEGWWGSSRKEPDPEAQRQALQRYHDQEDQDYQLELERFKKAVEDLAHDQRIDKEYFMSRLTTPNQRDPLFVWVHYKLPDTDYLKAQQNSGLKAQYDQEVQEILKHAIKWFDDIKATQPAVKGFDWQHQKDLAVRRARDNERRQGKQPGVLRFGGWDYGDQEDPTQKPLGKPRRRKK